jgi:hypothetical protein
MTAANLAGMPRRRSATILAAGLLALAGCGGGSNDEARKLDDRSVLTDAPALEKSLVSDAEVRQASASTPEHAFLTYWMSLQYQAWLDAVASYDEGLREYIGDDRLQYALANQALYFRSNRPRDVKIVESRGRSVIYFKVENAKGQRTPISQTWDLRSTGWRIVHDPYLDTALAQAQQLDVQIERDPIGQKAAPEAVRAGHAARKLQGAYAASKQDPARRAPSPPRR